jgi:hypothetical protein
MRLAVASIILTVQELPCLATLAAANEHTISHLATTDWGARLVVPDVMDAPAIRRRLRQCCVASPESV